MFESVIEQLKDNCNCIEVDNDSFNDNVKQLIELVSIMTCWTQKPCETFLSSDREECFDVGYIKQCNCGILVLDLLYKEIQECSIDVVLQLKEGIHLTEVSLGTENYSYDVYENQLHIDISEFIKNDICNPIKVNKVIVRYTAGYEKIPECLLPVFCDMLHHIIEMNECSCECTECSNDETEIEIDDTTEETLSISKVNINNIVNAYTKQLGLLSICRKERFKGMVV